jgi:UDP-N-acetylmuramate--alanine ligase
VIITPAVPNGHCEWNYFWNVVFRSKKKGRGFRIITKDTFVLQLQEHMERPQLPSILGHILYESGADTAL